MNRSERSIFLFFIEMCRYNVCKGDGFYVALVVLVNM